jgi:saccharopine dehydrogenase-like NADP-dependent oxidoreductase
MTRAVVLGAGMVGSTIAADLAAEPGWQVTVADARGAALARLSGVQTVRADLGDADRVRALAGEFDIALGALPSRLGLQTLGAVIDAGTSYVDISFMNDDPLPLSARAAARGVTAVVDCGVAPGLSNMLCGQAVTRLRPCTRLDIYVGGLPKQRAWPFEYKAGFAPWDVIEEYVRPARYVVGGKLVVREALSEPELIELPRAGTVEAFNTDGLRSLIHTLSVPDMREKTLRYPGHIELMRVFRETGLFSLEPIRVGDQTVRPRDVTAALLFPKWTYADGEADLTVMRVEARGALAGAPTLLRWDLYDEYDPASNARSMSRTTAFPATAVARMIARGEFPLAPGVYAPETPAQSPGFVERVLADLAARGVHVTAASEAA